MPNTKIPHTEYSIRSNRYTTTAVWISFVIDVWRENCCLIETWNKQYRFQSGKESLCAVTDCGITIEASNSAKRLIFKMTVRHAKIPFHMKSFQTISIANIALCNKLFDSKIQLILSYRWNLLLNAHTHTHTNI